MFRERVEDSGDAVGLHGHIRYHVNIEEVDRLERFASTHNDHGTFIRHVLDNHVFDPIGKRKGACIKFLTADITESLESQLFEVVAKGLKLSVDKIESKK